MIRYIFTLPIIFISVINAFGQSENIDKWKITDLEIQTITETTIFNFESIKPDTFPNYKAFYDTTGRMLKKQFNYERISNEFKYTTTFYKYGKNGEVIDARAENLSSSAMVEYPNHWQTECKYFDEADNLIKREFTKNETVETEIYTYKAFMGKNTEKSIPVLVQIDYYKKGRLSAKKVIDYNFY